MINRIKSKIINQKLHFPKNFLWGTSTSAYQTEGNNFYSNWFGWEKTCPEQEKCNSSCNHYQLFEEDIQLAKNILHNNAHRLSLEWSRLEPKIGEYCQQEVTHYRTVLKSLKDKGLKTFVTLHHFTSPQWFYELGDFTKRQNLIYFEKYVRFCAEQFGDLTDFWITINEPNVYVFFSYILAIFPPRQKNWLKAIKMFLNLTKAHRSAYQILHQKNPRVQVGTCLDYVAYQPKTNNPVDKILTTFFSFIGNDLFTLLTSKYHDFIGVNYYFRQIVSRKDILHATTESELNAKILGEEGQAGSSIYPEGIYPILLNLAQKYHLPIYITENGVAGADDKRKKFIQEHLVWIHKAIEKGANIHGYFYWSLMDNFEWAFGFKPRFGLFEVNYLTFQRIPRPSAYFYGHICKNNCLTI